MTAPCLKSQNKQLANLIARTRESGQIGDVEGIKSSGTVPIATGAWDAALADGTVSHIPSERRRMYAVLYPLLLVYRRELDEENRLLAHVRLLQHSPGRISDPMLADIATSHVELRYHAGLANIAAEQSLIEVRALGIKPDYGFLTGPPGARYARGRAAGAPVFRGGRSTLCPAHAGRQGVKTVGELRPAVRNRVRAHLAFRSIPAIRGGPAPNLPLASRRVRPKPAASFRKMVTREQ